MKSTLKKFDYSSQLHVTEKVQETSVFKASTGSLLEYSIDKLPRHTEPLPLWQITVPLGFVSIFLIGSLTACFMVEGRFVFDLNVNREQIRVRTDIDKTENWSSNDKTTADRYAAE